MLHLRVLMQKNSFSSKIIDSFFFFIIRYLFGGVMMKNLMIVVLAALMVSGCVTKVFFDSSEPGAEVYLDGEKIGETPFTANVSAYAWYDPAVTIKKEGYKELRTFLKPEPRVGNIVAGVLFFPALPISMPCLFTCYGPQKRQFFELEKESE